MADRKKVFDDVSSEDYEDSASEEVMVPTQRHREESQASRHVDPTPVEEDKKAFDNAEKPKVVDNHTDQEEEEEEEEVAVPVRDDEEEDEDSGVSHSEADEPNHEEEMREYSPQEGQNQGDGLLEDEPGFRKAVQEYYDNDEKDPLLLNEILREDDRSFDLSRYIFPRFNAQLLNYYTDPSQTLKKKKVEPPNAVELFVAYIIAADLRIVLYFIILTVTIFFTIVSLPISQIDLPNRGCYTYFGYKADCDKNMYTEEVELMACTSMKTRLQAGAAFTIIGLVVQVFCFTCCWLIIFCLPFRLGTKPSKRKQQRAQSDVASLASTDKWMKGTKVVAGRSRYVIGGVGMANLLFLLIPWACVASIYHGRFCEVDKDTTPRTTSYGAGFGLNITAWLLHALGLLIILVMPTSLI